MAYFLQEKFATIKNKHFLSLNAHKVLVRFKIALANLKVSYCHNVKKNAYKSMVPYQWCDK